MTREYAQGTSVSAETSKFDIMKVLAKHGIKQHAFMSDEDKSAIGFSYGGLNYRIEIIMPPEDHEAFTHTETGRRRVGNAARQAWESEVRRRWRSLLLMIKAKLVGCDDGIATFEEEFMPYMVTGDGTTLAKALIPRMREAAVAGRVPSALPFPGSK